MNAHQPPSECQAAKPECVTSLTTVRHSEGPPVADLLTIIKVNTGHTPVLPSPALGQYLFELHETGDYQLSVRGLGLGEDIRGTAVEIYDG